MHLRHPIYLCNITPTTLKRTEKLHQSKRVLGVKLFLWELDFSFIIQLIPGIMVLLVIYRTWHIRTALHALVHIKTVEYIVIFSRRHYYKKLTL